jgi:uncharacterized membrane protein
MSYDIKSGSSFKRIFLTGFVALFPLALTMMLLWFVWDVLLRRISEPIASLIIEAAKFIIRRMPETATTASNITRLDSDTWPKVLAGFVAILIALLFTYFLGLLLRTFIGKQLLAYGELILGRMPIIKLIYPHAKQISQFLFGGRKVEFHRVVTIQYPRLGVWSLGFATSPGPPTIAKHTGQSMVAVFVPTSPTPFTGWTVMVNADEVVDLDMTVDEAIRFTISCGVLTSDQIKDSGAAAAKVTITDGES